MTPLDGDETRGGPAEEGGNLDVLEGTADKVNEPVRKGGLAEDLENPRVINGVKGLGSVQKEDEPLGVVNNTLVEELVEVLNVGVATDAGQEAPLSRVNEGRDGRHDGVRNGTGEDAVVSVGDTDGTGVGDQTGLLFGKQEEEAVIEAGGGVRPRVRALRTP